jgi:hypothetical protein
MADKKTINGSDRWAIITKSDTVNLVEVPRAIYVSVGGTLTLVDSTGNAVDFGTAAVGLIQVQPARINSTGSTATVIGLY